jgi:pimeloyl-ACP methyl ester carboxylesterase
MKQWGLLCAAALLFAGQTISAGGAPKIEPKHAPKETSSIVGDWQGTLAVGGGISLHLVVHFVKQTGGELAGSLDSLDQNARGIPFSLVRQTGPKVHAVSALIHATFDGALAASGKTMAGTWSQGTPLPLTLTRMKASEVAAEAPPSHLQDPKPPYPYTVQNVTFPGGAAGVTLAGTLTVPLGTGPFPAAVLIAGSGPNDRDETILGHKPFWILADSLTRRGLAVLRYDKRGIGQSKGSYATATSQDFAADAQAAAAWLRITPSVDARKVGLIGHSEGALIAPLVAVQDPSTAFIILLAGTGVPGDRILSEQSALIGKALGMPAADITRNQAAQNELFAVVKAEPDPAVARTKSAALLRRMLAGMPLDKRKAVGPPEAFIQTQLSALVSPWMHYFLTYDPAPTLKQVRCPVLALDGSLDLQVPPEENLAAISAALKAGGNMDVTTQELPGLNHLFQTAKTGSPTEYAQIDETLAPIVSTMVGDWILAHTTGK